MCTYSFDVSSCFGATSSRQRIFSHGSFPRTPEDRQPPVARVIEASLSSISCLSYILSLTHAQTLLRHNLLCVFLPAVSSISMSLFARPAHPLHRPAIIPVHLFFILLQNSRAHAQPKQAPARVSSRSKREKGKTGRLRKALAKVSRGGGGGAQRAGGDLDAAAMAINPFGGGGRGGERGGSGEVYDEEGTWA